MAVVRLDQEVAQVKPRQVYMLVYCRRDGGATWQEAASGDGVVTVDVDDAAQRGDEALDLGSLGGDERKQEVRGAADGVSAAVVVDLSLIHI